MAMTFSESPVTQPPKAGWSALPRSTRALCGIRLPSASGRRDVGQAGAPSGEIVVTHHGLRREQPGLVEILEPVHSHERHRAGPLLLQDPEHVRHPFGPACAETVQVGPPDAHRLGAETKG